MKTKNKKELFSRGLYAESLRRIQLPSLILLIIISAVAVLIPVSQVAEDIEYSTPLLSHIDAAWANPLLLLMIFIAAPVLTFTLFSFMNRRSASDLYFSMPHTRVASYLSRIAALATAYALMILISSGISVLMLTVFRSHFVITWSNLLPYMLGCFVGALLVSAAICIGMSITGTVFNNIIVSSLVMFMPRFVLLFIALGVTSGFDLISSTHGFWPHVLRPNILTGFFDYLLNFSSGSKLALLDSSSQLYSLALAAVYFVIGGVLFCRRKSESAEHAAPSSRLRALYRVVLTMVICVPACLLIFTSQSKSYSTSIVTYIWFYVAALIVFCSYELITVKKWRALKKCLPSLAVVALLNVALLGTMQLCCRVELGFSPEADDVEYVSIVSDSSRKYFFSDWATSKSEEIRMTDSEARSIVCEALADSIELFKTDSGPYSPMSYMECEYQSLTVKVKSGIFEKYRTVYFTEPQLNRLYAALDANSEYRDIYMKLPKAENGTVYVDILTSSFDNSACEDIYELLCEEVASLNFESWYIYTEKTMSSEFADVLLYTAKDGDYISIPVSQTVTPRTARAIAELANSTCPLDVQDVVDYFESGATDESVSPLSGVYYAAGEEYGSWIDTSSASKVASCIDADGELDLSRDFMRFSFYIEIEHDDTSSSYYEYCIFVPAIDGAREILAEE